MENSNSLTFFLTVPLAAILFSWFVPKALQRIYAVFSSLIILVLTIFETMPMLSATSMEAAERLSVTQRLNWISELGLYLSLKMDSVSAWFIVLNAITAVVAFSLRGVWYRKNPRLFTSFGFFLVFALNAAFLSTNLISFYVAYEAVFVPMIFMVGIWGEHQKATAVLRFFLMSFLGSVFMLVSIFYLAWVHFKQTGSYSNEISDFVKAAATLGPATQAWVFLGFFLAFAIKVPLVPFHAWVRDVYVYSPMPGTVWMSGVLSKLGVFGFIRFVLPMFGKTCETYQGILMSLSAASVVYPALLAIRSNQPKTLLAYSSISHLGFVMLGVSTLKSSGTSAAILLSVGHTLVGSALFYLLHQVEERAGDISLVHYLGLSRRMPLLFASLFFMVLASVSLPGTLNFAGEFLVLLTAYPVSALCTIISGLGVILGAVYMLKFFQRLGLGTPSNPQATTTGGDLVGFDLGLMLVLIVVTVYLGFHPVLILKGN